MTKEQEKAIREAADKYRFQYHAPSSKNFLVIRNMIEAFINSGKPILSVEFVDCGRILDLEKELSDLRRKLEITTWALVKIARVSYAGPNTDERREWICATVQKCLDDLQQIQSPAPSSNPPDDDNINSV